MIIKNKDGFHFVPSEKIIYAEVEKHDLSIYYLKEKEIRKIHCRSSLSEYVDKLGCEQFGRCCVFALVNFKYIASVQNNRVTLNVCNTQFPLSLKTKKEFMQHFQLFLEKTAIGV